MKKTFFALLTVVGVALPSLTQAAVIVQGNTAATQIAAPGDVGGALLDQYTISLLPDAGAKITAIDLVFSGGVYQVQLGGAFGSVTRTPAIDNLAGFPAAYVAADSHSLIPSTGYSPAGAAGVLNEDALSGLSTGVPGGGVVPSLSLKNLGINNQVLGALSLAQIVLPRGATATFTGFVATSNDGGVPIAVSGTIGAIPEPASIAMAGMGLIGMIAAARRRNA